MTAPLALRASGMPLAMRCPGSTRVPELAIASTSEPAELGSAAHEALRPLAEGAGVDWEALPAIAARWAVEVEDLRALCAMGAKLWTSVEGSFRGALTEVFFEREIAPGVVLSGHVDLLAVTGSVARAGDWKTGRKDADYAHQMRAYGALVLLDEPALTEVTVTILWVRSGDVENYTMRRSDAETWLAEVRRRVVDWDGTFWTGDHCRWCPRSHECAAANAMVRRDVAMIMDLSAADALRAMRPEQIIELRRRAALVEKTAHAVTAAIRAHVEASGPVVTDEATLELEDEPRRKLDVAKAWPVLEEEAGFEDEQFAEVIDISITRTEKLVATRAGRGKGAAAVRSLKEKLEAASAVSLHVIKKLVEKRG